MVRQRITVIGGGYAGVLSAVRMARRSRKLERAPEIVLVTGRPWFVERVRLHQEAAGERRPRRSIAEILEGTDVRLRVGWVREVDLTKRTATIETEGGRTHAEAFDRLLVATGSKSAASVPGAEHALSCADEASAAALRARLDADPTCRVVVIGGGLTALELAAEIAERRPRARVALVTAGEVVPSFSPGARAHVRRVLARLRVELREHTGVAAIERDAVILSSGDAIPADVPVWAGGFAPTSLAREIGLKTDPSGRALVDARLRSISHDFVHVAGDAARCPASLRMGCVTAMPMGAFAADDIVRSLANKRPVPFSFSFAIQCASLGRRAAVVQRVDARDTARSFWFGGRPAAWVKEGICRFTIGSMTLERRGFSYRWPRAALPAEVPA